MVMAPSPPRMIANLFILTLAAAILSCGIPDSLGRGYVVNYYLEPQSTTNLDIEFLYSLDSYIPDGLVYGETDLEFSIADTNTIGYEIYGVQINQTWFSLQMIGYFVPNASGNYTFSITGADDQVLVRLGDGVAFSCCNTSSGGTEQESLYASGKTTVGGTGSIEETYYISMGYAIPIKISYSNTYYSLGPNAARLGFAISDSSGSDVSDYVFYDLEDEGLYCLSEEQTTAITSTATAIMSSQDTITETETVTLKNNQCSDITITERVTFATGSLLTIFTSGPVEGTSTYISCRSYNE